MKRAALLKTEPVGPKKEEGLYAVTGFQAIDGNTVLEIDIYDGAELKARYFADKEHSERWTWYECDRKWRGVKFENVSADIKAERRTGYWSYSEPVEYADKDDKETVWNYFAHQSLESWEYGCDRQKREDRLDRKFERINRDVESFGLIPDNVRTWAAGLFPEDYIFIRMNASEDGKERGWYCTACGGSGKTDRKIPIGKPGFCPGCGKEVYGKRYWIAVEKTIPVIVFQAHPDGKRYCEKQMMARMRWNEEGKSLELRARTIAIMKRGAHVGDAVYYGTDPNAEEFEQEWWTRNPGVSFRESMVYPGNIPEITETMIGVKHTGIEELVKHERVNINRWLYFGYYNIPALEYIIKRGMYRLAAELIERYALINGNGSETLQMLRENKELANRLRSLNGGIAVLRWLEYAYTKGLKVQDEDLRFFEQRKIYPTSTAVESVLTLGFGIRKIANYIRKLGTSDHALTEWQDYLSMARRLRYDLKDSIVTFPKNLKGRHDAFVEVVNERQDELRLKDYEPLEKKIIANRHLAERYRYETEGYIITPAVSCADLMKESRELHHCVGTSDTYMRKMAEGRSWILFLRRSTAPGKAYYTVEIDMENDKLLQWYSTFDRKPDAEEVKAVLDEFLAAVRCRARKAG